MSGFQKFDFNNNSAWKEFVSQLDPSMYIIVLNSPPHRIEKLKRGWYKEFIDPNFDPEAPDTQVHNHTHSSNCNHT